MCVYMYIDLKWNIFYKIINYKLLLKFNNSHRILEEENLSHLKILSRVLIRKSQNFLPYNKSVIAIARISTFLLPYLNKSLISSPKISLPLQSLYWFSLSLKNIQAATIKTNVNSRLWLSFKSG